ncbi:MAG: UDP-N-acetylglucosamine 2-epimerase [Candidatus Firestonebacteria bacterium RIFOXYC2_FULL_39_67]|nr:MAG: UDP-N-acetylglucosamine 2-epimerase [Candidatus Firestonebacteria bacterium RIFOXYD2_FULL_39_29]OGF56267.1 MAG: UDP-N-acetylglucosamine 2-epimerase [Candidatus Firestonebacteria bacterium RIFOXYC2_FULL_39_67]
MKIVSIVGARPQFVKAAVVSRALKKAGIKELLVHTGQHYDYKMSDIFFKELGIPKPLHLSIGSGKHGEKTGEMLEKIEKVLEKQEPDYCLVYGDTNSTLAGALAAAKLNIKIAHVEAGLRSFNMNMPEEVNRKLTDHISSLLFCPTKTAVINLKNEGIKKGIFVTGDVMEDSLNLFLKIAEKKQKVFNLLKFKHKEYFLVTVHRAENTGDPVRLKSIFDAIIKYKGPEIFVIPLHPRTKKYLIAYGLYRWLINKSNLAFVDPVGYLDNLILMKNAKKILTDSGGMQKEAYMLKVPCITMRDETEWVETVKAGWNIIVGTDKKKIAGALKAENKNKTHPSCYGGGHASEHIVKLLKRYS